MPNNCFRAVFRVTRREHRQAPMCSPGLGWGSTPASPGSRFLQHKGYAGSGLVFLVLDLGCNAFPPSSHTVPGCAACPLHHPAGLSLCCCSQGNLYVAAGGGRRLRALTTLGALGKFSPHSLASSNRGSPVYLWVFLKFLLCFYHLWLWPVVPSRP